MKKSVLFIALTAVIFSCKKKEEPSTFTATDVTGSSVVKGKITKDANIPDGAGGWTNGQVAAAGVRVAITVPKNSLYPNSTAQGADVYSTTTDSLGNYALTVRSNATGVTAYINVDNFNSTHDTLLNGVVRKGLSASFQGFSQNATLIMGQNKPLNGNCSVSNIAPNPNVKVGTAIVTGTLGIRHFTRGTGSISSTVVFDTLLALPNHVVYLDFYNDPYLLDKKTYSTTTDANGNFTFNVNTVASGTSGFSSQNADIWAPDMAATKDTLKAPSSRVTGKAGVFTKTIINVSSIYTGDIRNANYVNYTVFTQN